MSNYQNKRQIVGIMKKKINTNKYDVHINFFSIYFFSGRYYQLPSSSRIQPYAQYALPWTAFLYTQFF